MVKYIGPVFTRRKRFYASTYAYVHAYVDNEIQALEGIHIKWWFSRQRGFFYGIVESLNLHGPNFGVPEYFVRVLDIFGMLLYHFSRPTWR